MELQLEVLSHIDLPGLIQLRRTSRLYRSIIITRDYLEPRFANDETPTPRSSTAARSA